MLLCNFCISSNGRDYFRIIVVHSVFQIIHKICPHLIFRQLNTLFGHIEGEQNAAGYTAAGIFFMVFQAAKNRTFARKLQDIDQGLIFSCKTDTLIGTVHFPGFENIQYLSRLVCYDFNRNSSFSVHRRPVKQKHIRPSLNFNFCKIPAQNGDVIKSRFPIVCFCDASSNTSYRIRITGNAQNIPHTAFPVAAFQKAADSQRDCFIAANIKF